MAGQVDPFAEFRQPQAAPPPRTNDPFAEFRSGGARTAAEIAAAEKKAIYDAAVAKEAAEWKKAHPNDKRTRRPDFGGAPAPIPPPVPAGQYDPEKSLAAHVRRAFGSPAEADRALPLPQAAALGLAGGVDYFMEEGPTRARRGYEEFSKGEGHRAKGAVEMIRGVGTGSMIAGGPFLARAFVMAPIQTATTIAATIAASKMTRPAAEHYAKEAGYTGDEVTLIGDLADAAVGTVAGVAGSTTGSLASAKLAASLAAKKAGMSWAQIIKAMPPTREANYTKGTWDKAAPYMELETPRKASNLTDEPPQWPGLQGVVNAAKRAIRNGIEPRIKAIVDQFPDDVLPVDVLAAVRAELSKSQKDGWADDGEAALLEVYSKLSKPLKLADADAIRSEMNSTDRAPLRRTASQQHHEAQDEAANAAWKKAREVISNAFYDHLEARGAKGVRELRDAEGAIIQIRRNAESHLHQADIEAGKVARFPKTQTAANVAEGLIPTRVGKAAFRLLSDALLTRKGTHDEMLTQGLDLRAQGPSPRYPAVPVVPPGGFPPQGGSGGPPGPPSPPPPPPGGPGGGGTPRPGGGGGGALTPQEQAFYTRASQVGYTHDQITAFIRAARAGGFPQPVTPPPAPAAPRPAGPRRPFTPPQPVQPTTNIYGPQGPFDARQPVPPQGKTRPVAEPTPQGEPPVVAGGAPGTRPIPSPPNPERVTLKDQVERAREIARENPDMDGAEAMRLAQEQWPLTKSVPAPPPARPVAAEPVPPPAAPLSEAPAVEPAPPAAERLKGTPEEVRNYYRMRSMGLSDPEAKQQILMMREQNARLPPRTAVEEPQAPPPPPEPEPPVAGTPEPAPQPERPAPSGSVSAPGGEEGSTRLADRMRRDGASEEEIAQVLRDREMGRQIHIRANELQRQGVELDYVKATEMAIAERAPAPVVDDAARAAAEAAADAAAARSDRLANAMRNAAPAGTGRPPVESEPVPASTLLAKPEPVVETPDVEPPTTTGGLVSPDAPGYTGNDPAFGGKVSKARAMRANAKANRPVRSAADIAREMGTLRQPRPLNKLYGPNPTKEQVAIHADAVRAYNREMGRLRREHAVALERDNAAFREKNR